MVAFDHAVITWEAPPRPGPGRRVPFTAHEDRAIAWAYGRGWPLKRIGAQTGRHWTSVQQRVERLIAAGALERRARLQGRRWTAAEERKLRAWWGTAPDAEVARLLGRTPDALKIRATRFLKQPRRANADWLAGRQVAALFGVDPTTPRAWVRRGWVPARKLYRGGGHTEWQFRPDDLEAMVRAAPWRFDARRMAAPESGPIARALQAALAEAEAGDPWLTLAQAGAEVGYVPPIVYGWLRRYRAPVERRPHYGAKGGDPRGTLVVRRSVLLAARDRRDADERVNRSLGARQRAAYRQAEAAWYGAHDGAAT